MQRLCLFRDMTTTLRIPFRVQLTQQFQPLIEDVKKNFIAVFHTGLIKKSLQRLGVPVKRENRYREKACNLCGCKGTQNILIVQVLGSFWWKISFGAFFWGFLVCGVASLRLFVFFLFLLFVFLAFCFCLLLVVLWTRGVGGLPRRWRSLPYIPLLRHIRPSRPSRRLLSRMLFGLSRQRRPDRFGLNASVAHAACSGLFTFGRCVYLRWLVCFSVVRTFGGQAGGGHPLVLTSGGCIPPVVTISSRSGCYLRWSCTLQVASATSGGQGRRLFCVYPRWCTQHTFLCESVICVNHIIVPLWLRKCDLCDLCERSDPLGVASLANRASCSHRTSRWSSSG